MGGYCQGIIVQSGITDLQLMFRYDLRPAQQCPDSQQHLIFIHRTDDGFIDGLPVALNLTGACYDDANVLNIAYAIENILGYKNQTSKGGE